MRILMQMCSSISCYLALSFSLVSSLHAETLITSDAAKNLAVLTALTAACAGSSYVMGSLSGSWYHAYAYRKYADVLLIWEQNQDDVDTVTAELIRYVLKHHIRNRWFDNTYTNYPLVEYVVYLDSCIFWLWLLAYCQMSDVQQVNMRTLMQQLTLIRNAIIGDYKYTKEKREFEQRQEHKLLHNKA